MTFGLTISLQIAQFGRPGARRGGPAGAPASSRRG
jgi:hypothetical protein